MTIEVKIDLTSADTQAAKADTSFLEREGVGNQSSANPDQVDFNQVSNFQSMLLGGRSRGGSPGSSRLGRDSIVDALNDRAEVAKILGDVDPLNASELTRTKTTLDGVFTFFRALDRANFISGRAAGLTRGIQTLLGSRLLRNDIQDADSDGGGSGGSGGISGLLGGAGGARGGGGKLAALLLGGAAIGAVITGVLSAIEIAERIAKIFTGTLTTSIRLYNRLNSEVENLSQSLGEFNGVIAAARAEREVARIENRIRQGRELQGVISGRERQGQELDRAVSELTTAVASELIPLLTATNENLVPLINIIGDNVEAFSNIGLLTVALKANAFNLEGVAKAQDISTRVFREQNQRFRQILIELGFIEDRQGLSKLEEDLGRFLTGGPLRPLPGGAPGVAP